MKNYILLLCAIFVASSNLLGTTVSNFPLESSTIAPSEITHMPPITVNDLPVMARKMLTTNFGIRNVVSCQLTHAGKRFLVRLTDKRRVFFDEAGNWIYIDCKNQNVPQLLVPSKVRNHIAEKFGPYVQVIKMSRKEGKIKVLLSNEVKMTFDC